jgi:hypothetical protein
LSSKLASCHWRRYFRLSVRGLIVFVLGIGIWIGWVVRSARIQRVAVAAIKRAGGRVAYDWERTNGKPDLAGKPWAPRWLVECIGVDYFGSVSEVSLVGLLQGPRSTIEHIGRLTRLKHLFVFGSPIGDTALAHLKGHSSLEILFLDGTQVTGAGLAHVSGLTNLTMLSLRGTRVCDSGLAHLRGLRKLAILNLDGTRVSDLGLIHLTGLSNLACLSLEHTQVSDAGLARLKELTSLSILDVRGTLITGAGRRALRKDLPWWVSVDY